jgi:hypothetical protein
MYLTTMTHRDELFELTLRWLNDRFDPHDGMVVTQIFLYESAVSAILVDRMTGLLTRLFNGPFHIERIWQKQELRRRLIHYLPRQSERTRQLIQRFTDNPEYFFPRLPIDALLVTGPGPCLVAIARIKRLSRVAEKVSFRLVDALFKEIQAEARAIASRRAASSGVSLLDLVSSESEMYTDFTAAETEVARRFRNHNVWIPRQAMTVNDLLGFKIIGDQELIDRVVLVLQQEPGVALIEIEKHSGDYNATNMLVEITLPTPDALVARLDRFDWSIARQRGLDPEVTQRGFSDYLARGADTVRMEIILTTFDELMESEFGRSTHELRVLRLRQRQAYNGPIAHNAAYLIEYLLALASSPTTEIAELPIKMYGRYLPETIASAKGTLFGYDIDAGMLDAFCLKTISLNERRDRF